MLQNDRFAALQQPIRCAILRAHGQKEAIRKFGEHWHRPPALRGKAINRDSFMMPVAHCTEVAQQIDVMGHEHHFERTPAMCALPPIDRIATLRQVTFRAICGSSMGN